MCIRDSDKIDEMLESVAIVAVMLVIGGIFMLFCDKIFSKGSEDTVLTEKKAFNIGLFQCIAMIPGVSLSLIHILLFQSVPIGMSTGMAVGIG